MAKIIYACSRKSSFGQEDERRLRKICERLEPDNLRLPVTHRIAVNGSIAFAIVNDRGSTVDGNSVLLGCLFEGAERWSYPGEPCPDGAFALFRESGAALEVASDAAGSRTIWYCFNDQYFVASTSQRAIVMFLGAFQFNEQVTPWILSTGALGPGFSWDRRIKRLPPESSVMLDKHTWSLSLQRHAIAFSPVERSRRASKVLLTKDISSVIHSLGESAGIDFKKYVLPLSGGYDSRGILCFLARRGIAGDLRTITWGLADNLDREKNDAAVAKELAARLGVKHRYHHTDMRSEPLARVIDRFICCGEGRVDHLAGYLDGLEIWRKLLEDENCSGIIRGDEGFGWVPVSSELTVRLSVGIGLCSDYRNLKDLIRKFGLPAQEFPSSLQRQEGETLSGWRDRLYHAYRLPTILAALSDVKYSYVEIVNPLLAGKVLHRVRELPDRLRTDKALFKDIVDTISPDVPYATEGANASMGSVLRKREIAGLMRNKLLSEQARQQFGTEFLNEVARGIRDEGFSPAKRPGTRANVIKSLVPRALKNWIRDRVAKPSLDPNVLAFRVYMILRMREILEEDCAAMESRHPRLDTRMSAAG
ncbi:asparagine synthase-related protein [Noviherbaspirillum denitrificans]|uniref:Asparagine synthetase domain-containing protein n=1 Tax=Noviherbaspirillum denitrificans TaxID=1968433 RepID=A0A254TDF3_9BURK|nr:asparagine synthase-related protein [Noviherbaspirillum denitrificans]OWW18563.1 hypothetical protein AYR66_00695 [Noviherbaspirillum denitrificans]